MTTATNHLAFGDNQALPEGATFAWGCRAIVNQDGYVDFPSSRSDFFGDQGLLYALDAEFSKSDLRSALSKGLSEGEIGTRVAGLHVLHAGPQFTVTADTKASAGYAYVTAYLTSEGAPT